MKKDIIETRGVTALQRLFATSHGASEQCRCIARFLLGLYHGQRFPFDLTDLRAIDDAMFEDCMAVLRMDARVTRQEVHLYIEDEGRGFEQLASIWAVDDMEKVREDAKRTALPEVEPAPLRAGELFTATLDSYGNAPGYRDVTVSIRLAATSHAKVELALSSADTEALMLHIAHVHALAWRKSEQGPLDMKAGEKRPAWLDRAPAQWSSA